MPLGRVAIVSPFPPPIGGMAHQADILAGYLEGEGLTVHRIRTNRFRNVLPLRDMASWHRFWSLRKAFDVVNIHTCCYASYFGTTAPIIWMAKKLGKRVVVTYHGGSAREVFERTGECGLRWLRIADVVTVPSRFLHDIFSEFNLKTRIVANVSEPGVGKEPPRRPRPEAPRLIMTRGLGHYYNVPCTVRAFQIVRYRYPKATLLLAGGGNRERHVRALVRRLNVPNVAFLGHLDRRAIWELYRSGDIFVNSSNEDNLPLTFIEAFLFGVPIVTTNAGGIPYMVEHGKSARVVERNDHEALAREIIHLLEHPDQAQEQARAAQASIDQYRWEAVRDDWFDVLGVGGKG
jgi:glycosyltransferase involved in cell wall biosynthesis